MILITAATVTMLALTVIGATTTTSVQMKNGALIEVSPRFYKITVNGSQYKVPRPYGQTLLPNFW